MKNKTPLQLKADYNGLLNQSYHVHLRVESLRPPTPLTPMTERSLLHVAHLMMQSRRLNLFLKIFPGL